MPSISIGAGSDQISLSARFLDSLEQIRHQSSLGFGACCQVFTLSIGCCAYSASHHILSVHVSVSRMHSSESYVFGSLRMPGTCG